ncbi:DUF7662 domain-containing protein [Brevundimonas aveniformis]|uniref:DUF7662 domain-containing protein n=1 Tax=Brevundimonas aveniformis TaxID=370977 RepID=UPI0003F8BF16|nr:hypothetical protein [Brevundimonas aveniformis]
MAKYEPLEHFLRGRRETEIPLSFADIEEVIGAPLPPAAARHRAWWSNNPSNNVMTKSWLSAGFITERVDLASRRVVFRRSGKAAPPPAPPARSAQAPVNPSAARVGWLDRFRTKMAGTVTIPEGVDITEPTGEVWDAER